MLKILQKPIILFLITNVMVFGLLYFYRQPADAYILMAGGVVILMALMAYFCLTRFNWGDEYLFIIASMLVTLGVAMLCRLNYNVGVKQIIWYALGIIMFICTCIFFRYFNFWKNLQWVYFWTSVALLILTQLVGTTVSGAKNWIIVGGFSFQPSEAVKILYALFLASHFSKQNHKKYFDIPEKWVVMLAVYVYCAFFVLQHEWGSMVLFFLTYLVTLFVHGSSWKILALNLMVVGGVGWVAATQVSHIKVRVANWLDPFADAANRGYQTTQSLFAIASGNFFGSGIGLGKPQFIPEVHSDFIFSAICEEMGILGGCAVILLFFILIYRGFKIALAARGTEKWTATIITATFGLQTFIIIGGVINLIPLTGITLPFISYGGSSLVTAFISLGILQGISCKA
ncbi:MAG: FtsW/RodA/SpoVE family cell cycle protein [Clostridiales bacterium]|jgi:cell division protein FtsW (lipid II flippase)|nr:FtsW/RodA/SpoVE family cell cycle protein [Clostridiales bacterium]